MRLSAAVVFFFASCSQQTQLKPELKPVPVAESAPMKVTSKPSEKLTRKELVAWRRDVSFAQLLEEAKRTNKPLMINLCAAGYEPCMEMDKNVYTRQDVADVTSTFLAMKLDGERGEGAEVYAKYNVVGFPTILFLLPDGAELDRIFDGTSAEAFIRTVKDYSQNKNTLAVLDAQVAAAGANVELSLLHEVGYRHALRGDTAKAEEFLQRVIERDKDNAEGYATSSLFVLGTFLYLRGQKPNPQKALETLQRIQREYPNSREAHPARHMLAKAYLSLNQLDKVRSSLDEYISGDAVSEDFNRYAWFCFKNNYDLPRGVEVAKLGLVKDPRNDALLDTLADLLFASGDVGGALTALDKAIKLSPDNTYYQEKKLLFLDAR